MTWLKVDDSFESHPKVRAIPRRQRLAAVGLWTLAGSWCARHLTDGHISALMVEELGGTSTTVRALVEARLWVETSPGVYEFHDWEDWQPTREKVTKRRQDSAARQAAWRERAAQRRSGQQGNDEETRHGDEPVTRDERASNASQGSSVTRESRSPVPSRPVPTRPDPLLGEVVRRLSRGRSTTTTDEDVALWQGWAGPDVDLEAECRAWLLHNADVDLDNPRAALKGWLERARTRAAGTPPAPAGSAHAGTAPHGPQTPPGRPTPVPSRPECPRHPGQPLPPACPDCAREKATPPPGWRALADPTDNPSTEEEPPW